VRVSKAGPQRSDQSPARTVHARRGSLGAIQREAKTLAALNHPDVPAIYSLEDQRTHRSMREITALLSVL
jgi:hypothetical protein